MIERICLKNVQNALNRQAAVALIGPRQVGKTTLAFTIAEERKSVYLDLESLEDREKLKDPVLFFSRNEDRLIILDEIHRMPDLFQVLRGVIDEGRRKGLRNGRFLILGSASIDLLRQSSETLAGRIEYIDMLPINLLEAKPSTKNGLIDLWVRGGFPDSYLAQTDEDSYVYRRNFIRTYLERDVPQYGPRIPAETLNRLWTMLAHYQGQLLNASQLASSLSVSAPTVTSYIDLLIDLLLVRRLQPFHANTKKRLVKSPRIYVRDSGLIHALLNIADYNQLASHPIIGASFEGFVIENIASVISDRISLSFYRTAVGAEIDLILSFPNGQIWAVEIKNNLRPKLEKGFYHAWEDVKPNRSFVIYPGDDSYPLSHEIDVLSLFQLMQLVQSHQAM